MSNARLAKLEAVRGFAAIYVVFHHLFASDLVIFGVNFSFLFRFGQEAVILFFLLSGFVIYYSYQKSSDKSLKVFFLKRFLRIYIPLLIVFMSNYLLISFESNHFIKISWNDFLGNLFMLQDNVDKKPNVICAPFLGNDPLWSLSYEWWFYFLFFFLMKIKNKNLDNGVFFFGFVSAVTYLFYPFFINREVMYLSIWWIGLVLAKLYINKENVSFLKLKIPLLFLLADILVLLLNIFIIKYKEPSKILEFSSYPILEFRHFLFTFILLIFVIIWNELKWRGFNIILLPFRYFAPISFVIYISHWFLIYKATYLNNIIDNKNLATFIYFIVCLLFSYLVEKIIYPKLYRFLKTIIKI